MFLSVAVLGFRIPVVSLYRPNASFRSPLAMHDRGMDCKQVGEADRFCLVAVGIFEQRSLYLSGMQRVRRVDHAVSGPRHRQEGTVLTPFDAAEVSQRVCSVNRSSQPPSPTRS